MKPFQIQFPVAAMVSQEVEPWRTLYPALQPLPLSQGERVGLGDDRNHVHLVVDGLHELDIQRFQAGLDRKPRCQQILEKNDSAPIAVFRPINDFVFFPNLSLT